MKSALWITISWLCSIFAFAQTSPDPAPLLASFGTPTIEADAISPALRKAVYNDEPQVRAEVLMVSVPQDKALTLLPALRDPDRVSSAQEVLLKMVAQKEAALIGWPELHLHSGGRAECEAHLEVRYPSEFDQPTGPQTLSFNSKKKRTSAEQALQFLRLSGLLVPVTFEYRSTGVSLQVEAIVGKEGNSVTLRLAPHYVWMDKATRFETTTADLGKPAFVEQPVFQTRKVSVQLTLRSGERRLIYVGRPTSPGGSVELFILGATILPTPPGK